MTNTINTSEATKLSSECFITTVDNPFNPFKQFDAWFNYDVVHGYNTCGYLSRIADAMYPFDDTMSDDEYSKNFEKIVDEIVNNSPLRIYKKVYESESQ